MIYKKPERFPTFTSSIQTSTDHHRPAASNKHSERLHAPQPWHQELLLKQEACHEPRLYFLPDARLALASVWGACEGDTKWNAHFAFVIIETHGRYALMWANAIDYTALALGSRQQADVL